MTLTISSPGGRTTVTLAPEHGGRVAQITVDGLDLLAGDPTAGPLQWGCYPMVPWAGRLDRGELHFAGAVHRFPLAMPPHAIHGTTWDVPWEVAGAADAAVTMRLALALPWPFGGHVEHDVTATDGGVAFRIEVVAGDHAMPVAVGWHPWFRRTLARGDGAVIDLAAEAMWARGSDGLPTGELVDPPPGPWDDCFTELLRPPTLTWPGALRMTVESDCDQWVVYDEQAHAVCIEPQSSPPDGLNRSPFVIQPGQAHSRTMALRWSTP